MKNVLNKIPGFEIKAVKAGIKTSGNLDLGLIAAKETAKGAGVFTQSKVVAAPVILSRETLKTNAECIKAIIVNAGNANACTGKEGLDNAKVVSKKTAELLGAEPEQILQCSTGIIGEQLPIDSYLNGITQLIAAEPEMGQEFAEAIMTTDQVRKEASIDLSIGHIVGVCKGSGMIAPNMATMLGFILTDINITQSLLQQALEEVVPMSFNAVTIDSDTSTNDTVLLLSSCCSGEEITDQNSAAYIEFRNGLYEICFSLAEQVAKDGEGATKIVRVTVKGATSADDARKAARTVAESPLVKTAMFGCDPNWGRIIAALGRSGCMMKEEDTDISICSQNLLYHGTPQKFDADKVSALLKDNDINIEIDLNLGENEMTILTCDYSYDYIKINADYHT